MRYLSGMIQGEPRAVSSFCSGEAVEYSAGGAELFFCSLRVAGGKEAEVNAR